MRVRVATNPNRARGVMTAACPRPEHTYTPATLEPWMTWDTVGPKLVYSVLGACSCFQHAEQDPADGRWFAIFET